MIPVLRVKGNEFIEYFYESLDAGTTGKKLNSSQSRIAKMEKGDPSVSIDLLIKSLFALGISKTEIAKAIE